MLSIPLFSARIPFQKFSTPVPMHVIGPIPVMTARLRLMQPPCLPLLRGPRDWNTGTLRSHYHEVPIASTLQKTNVAVMRQDLRPQLQVCSCFEDRHFRRVHENEIRLEHSSSCR